MNEFQGFKGPWRVAQTGTGCVKVVADYGMSICHFSYSPTHRESHARLIAAAPDLLEALVMVRDADDDSGKDGLPRIPGAARSKIDRAIAKALNTDTTER